MTTWSLGNPHADSRSSQQPEQTAAQHWVSFLPLSPFQHTKKAPRLHRPPWYCLNPHNSSKNTEKIPLALCKHKTFLLLIIPFHIYTQVFTLAISAAQFDFNSGLQPPFVVSQLCCSPKIPQQSFTQIWSKFIFSSMFIYHTEFRKSSWASKTPQKMCFLH